MSSLWVGVGVVSGKRAMRCAGCGDGIPAGIPVLRITLSNGISFSFGQCCGGKFSKRVGDGASKLKERYNKLGGV